MALKFAKKPVFTRISAKIEATIAQELNQFVDWVVERERADNVTHDMVIQEIVRDYLAGTSADARQWRQHVASLPAGAAKNIEPEPSAPSATQRVAQDDSSQFSATDLNAQVDQALNLGKEDGVKPVKPVDRDLIQETQQRLKNSQGNKSPAGQDVSLSAPDASAT